MPKGIPQPGRSKRKLADDHHEAVKRHRQSHKHLPEWWAHDRIHNIRGRAKRKGVPFRLAAKDILVCLPPNLRCPVLDIPLVFGHAACLPDSPSIDRIIPELGYVPGNIRVISMRANSLKSNATADELQRVLDDLRGVG
jgi:hypothetical protein